MGATGVDIGRPGAMGAGIGRTGATGAGLMGAGLMGVADTRSDAKFCVATGAGSAGAIRASSTARPRWAMTFCGL